MSAYAQPGREARHNLNYWQFGDYLGIGAGAHSKLSFPHRVICARRATSMPAAYMQHAMAGNAVHQENEVARDDLGFEFMLNAMRLTGGVRAEPVCASAPGMALNAIERRLDAAEAKGLLYRDHMLIRPTELGQRFLNDLQEMFLRD